MTEDTNLPSADDLDAVNAESEASEATAPAKTAHDAVLDDLTKPAMQTPDLTPVSDIDAAIAYVEGKGYSREAAIDIVKTNGVDTILTSKAHEGGMLHAQGDPNAFKGFNRRAEQSVISRHGEMFNPEIHAQLPTGDPKTDSAGRFISKENDYSGPRRNPQFPD